MRKLPLGLPSTDHITDESTLEYARLLNIEIENMMRDIDKYVSKVVVSSLTAAGTLSADDELVLCNGTFTVTLPPAASSEGKVYLIKNIGSGTITIDGDDSETIDESTTKSLYQYESNQCVSDGTEWWII